MPEPIVVTLAIAVAVVLAWIIAIFFRFFDDPVTELPPAEQKEKRFWMIVKICVGILLAVLFGAWTMLEAGMDLWVMQNFAALVFIGIGGVGSVKAIINGAKKVWPS